MTPNLLAHKHSAPKFTVIQHSTQIKDQITSPFVVNSVSIRQRTSMTYSITYADVTVQSSTNTNHTMWRIVFANIMINGWICAVLILSLYDDYTMANIVNSYNVYCMFVLLLSPSVLSYIKTYIFTSLSVTHPPCVSIRFVWSIIHTRFLRNPRR
jgi:hypothetical protein